MDKLVFREEIHPNRLLEGLNRLRLNGSFCDVTICCGGKEFPCHRNVLASFSPYFEAMFTAGMMESRQHSVNINEVEPEEFGLLVNFAYTSTVEISTANVQALLAAANLFNVTAVKDACCRFLELRVMDEQNCVGIHLFAETHSCKTLEQRSMHHILDHFSDVYQQEEFLSVSVDKLTQILASDDLNAPKEETVFEAAMLWLNRCPTRRQSLEKVFELIRLPLLSPSYLHDVIECVDVVKESQGCQWLISEAKKQHLLPSCHTALPRSPTVILMVGGQNNYGFEMEDVDCFDPLNNRWKTLKRLPDDVITVGLVVLGSTVYMAGAKSHAVSCSIWRYDPSHDSWLMMASMKERRSCFGLVALGGYVFAVGGFLRNEPTASVERYDPYTNIWQSMESVGMPALPKSKSVVALDGLIYVIGGTVCHRKVHTYNPETSLWTEVAPMQRVCRAPTACTLKGKIYAIGGRHLSHNTALDTVECYDPKTNQWTMCAPMKKPHCQPSVAVANGQIYVLGGETEAFDTSPERTMERYCDQTDSWEIIGEIPQSCLRHRVLCVPLRLRKDALAQADRRALQNKPLLPQ